MEENDNIVKETSIDDTIENIESVDAVDNETVEETEECSDTESAEDIVPVFEREGWTELVDKFEEDYPIAKELKSEIGECILEDEHLWEDESCLTKALLQVLCEKYTPDSLKAEDETFLNKYIYGNDNIRSHIVDEYMESLDRSRMPSTITRGGRISLASPAKPHTIKEAGAIAERIMKR